MTAKEYFESLKIPDWIYYQNVERAGGQASVLKVRSITTKRLLGAFRFLKSNKLDDIKRFKRELDILQSGKYDHPNIIKILSSSESEHNWYISKWGEPFESYWAEVQGHSNCEQLIQEAVRVIKNLCTGLARMH